jgi:hypothetical protein
MMQVHQSGIGVLFYGAKEPQRQSCYIGKDAYEMPVTPYGIF